MFSTSLLCHKSENEKMRRPSSGDQANDSVAADEDDRVIYLENDIGDEVKFKDMTRALFRDSDATESPQYEEVFHVPRLRSSRSASDDAEEKQPAFIDISSEEMTSFAPKVTHITKITKSLLHLFTT